MTRLGKAAAAAAIVAASVVASLAAAELFLDVFHRFLPRDVRIMWIRRAALPRTIAADPALGYSLRPDYSGAFANGRKTLRIVHAPYPGCPARGYRGAPGEDPRGADVAVVGDSILYGAEVDQGDAMPALLQKLSGRRVVNLAVTGYGTTQELELYRACGSRLKPKLVLLFPFANDPLDNVHFAAWKRASASGPLPFAKWCMILGVKWPSPLCSALTGLDRRSTLAELVIHRWARAIKFGAVREPEVAGEGVASMCRDIAGFRDEARRGGARLAAIFPGQWRGMDPPQTAALDRVMDCARKEGIPVLDLGAERPYGAGLLGRLDAHWNEAGHRRAAEQTWRFLLSEGLLPPPPAAVAASSGPDPAGGFVSPCARKDALLGFSYAPGCSGWRVWNGRASWASYNAFGLRDRDYPPHPAPGTARVLAVGGSMVAGSGLAESERPPRVLERSLARRGLKAEVVDAGIEGYTGRQTAAALPGLLAYEPQFVVYYLPSHHVFADRAASESAGLPRLADVAGRIRASREISRLPDDAARFENLIAPTLDELRRMRDACRARGARFLVAYAAEEIDSQRPLFPRRPPFLARLAEKLWLRPFRFDGRRLLERLNAEGFEVLSLAPEAPALAAPENRLPGDYHWNAAGAALAADAEARELVRARKAGPAPRGRSSGSTPPARD